ncbi:hypothetical protein PoB_002851300 [Plakobranchus ocellatus]|uniref:Uncharacterized protein n=1 Tax=Plakobranchus ocellatus TaxID=259542 RepID=A0AAV4A5V1_9GAST|nr:hypothetical protein PoB_002851300 [Plakobranchus ocellatus]
MRVLRPHSVSVTRRPPERAYLWSPAVFTRLPDSGLDFCVGGTGLHGSVDKIKDDCQDGAKEKGKDFATGKKKNASHRTKASEHVGLLGVSRDRIGFVKDGGVENGARGVGLGTSATGRRKVPPAGGDGSVRRPVTAVTKSRGMLSGGDGGAGRESSTLFDTNDCDDIENHTETVTPAVTDSAQIPDGNSVIYSIHKRGSSDGQQTHSRCYRHKDLEAHQRRSSNYSEPNHTQESQLETSARKDAGIRFLENLDECDSEKGKEEKHSEKSHKNSFKLRQEPSRSHSYLGFSSRDTFIPRDSARDSFSFHFTRHGGDSQLYSARSTASIAHRKTYNPQPSGGSAFKSKERPQTARVSPSHKTAAHAAFQYRRKNGARRQVITRYNSSTDVSFQHHLQRQKQNRHQPPSLTSNVKRHDRSGSPASSSGSCERKTAPTPNLYRQIALARPESSSLTSAQRPQSETRQSFGVQQHGETSAERREALSVQRSQSSLSFLGTGRSPAGNFMTRFELSTNENLDNLKQSFKSTNITGAKTETGFFYSENHTRKNNIASPATITTRTPSSARISVDTRRHSESSKILDLVGRQPGFLSTLALLPSTLTTEDHRENDLETDTTDFKINNESEKLDTANVLNPTTSKKSLDVSDNLLSKNNSGSSINQASIDINVTNVNLTPSPQKVNRDLHKVNRDVISSPSAAEIKRKTFQETNPLTDVYEDVINGNAQDPKINQKLSTTSPGIDITETRLQKFNTDRHQRSTFGVVTFNLPDDEKRSIDTQDSQEQLEQEFEDSQERTAAVAEDHDEMSAPELPPIAVSGSQAIKAGNSPIGKTPRGDKRRTSNNSNHSSGSRNSIHQMSTAVNNKSFYNRKASNSSNNASTAGGAGNNSNNNNASTTNTSTGKRMKKKRLNIPRNHSDSSLKGLLAQQTASFTGSSGSSNFLGASNAEGRDGSVEGNIAGRNALPSSINVTKKSYIHTVK